MWTREGSEVRLLSQRVILRDLTPADEAAFVAYQMDRRYLALYDLPPDEAGPRALFDRFLRWQTEQPRLNLQLGVFDARTSRLCGCAGLRRIVDRSDTAELGIELAPADWGRYRIALDTAICLVDHGFRELGLDAIVGTTASGNRRVEKLASRFGATLSGRRTGPDWMRARGWEEVDWILPRDAWRGRQVKQDALFQRRAAIAGTGRGRSP